MKKGDILNIYYCEDCGGFLSGSMVGLHNSDHTIDRLKVQVIG